jgi:integrase
MPDSETETLTAAQVASVLKAYRELEQDSEDVDAAWCAAARRMTTLALSTGPRRGELLGLRWQDVELLERRLHVRQAFVRNEVTTPKSKAGRRTVELGAVATDALEEQFATTVYRAPESVVFCHPALGTPLDPSKLTTYARKGTRSGWRRGGLPPVARPATHGAYRDGGCRRAVDVRPGEGRTRAGFDHRAVSPCVQDELPRRR